MSIMKKIAALYRASYSGLSPSSWWLSLVMLINRSGTMVLPFMTLYLTTRLNFTLSQAGMIMGIFGAGAICGGFLGGRLCSLLGFYNVQLITLAGGGVMFLVLGYMESFTSICIVTFILSLINESFRPANSIAIAHYSKEENRTRSYSLNRLAINMGWALGGSLGGFLAAHNYHLLFILDGCTSIFAAILLRIFLAPASEERKKKKSTNVNTAARFDAYRDQQYLFFNVMVILYAYTFFQLFSTLPIYLKKVLHLSEQFIGLTMTINGILVALVEMVLIFKLEGRRHPMQYTKWGALLMGLSFIIFNLLPHEGAVTTWLSVAMLVALISTVLVTFGEMFSMPFMNTFWISRTNDDNRGGYAGLYTVSWALAQVLGWWTGPTLADKIGFTWLWWLVGGTALATAAGFWLLQQWAEKKASD
jgi:predicted MFS family arabinose efflux permease